MKLFSIFTVFTALVNGKNKGKDFSSFTTIHPQVYNNVTMYPLDRIESERGQHKCAAVPIPKIKCAGCASGYPKYVRDCAKPNPMTKAKYKCKAVCGPGFTIMNGHPRRMKCLGVPRKWKVNPNEFGGTIQCVKK